MNVFKKRLNYAFVGVFHQQVYLFNRKEFIDALRRACLSAERVSAEIVILAKAGI